MLATGAAGYAAGDGLGDVALGGGDGFEEADGGGESGGGGSGRVLVPELEEEPVAEGAGADGDPGTGGAEMDAGEGFAAVAVESVDVIDKLDGVGTHKLSLIRGVTCE